MAVEGADRADLRERNAHRVPVGTVAQAGSLGMVARTVGGGNVSHPVPDGTGVCVGAECLALWLSSLILFFTRVVFTRALTHV